MRISLIQTIILIAYANDNDAFVPEIWAQESLMVLENNMLAANLVHRDFQNEIASYGDIVNTRRPGNFTAARKGNADDVTDQDASATNVAVPLNQHLHTTFIIKDQEASKSMKDLVTEYLHPAAISLAQQADRIVLGQTYQFLANSVGALGTTISKTTVIAAREKLNTLKCPQGVGQRNLLVSPNMEGALLGISEFTQAQAIGDDGTALKEGSMGRKFGFDLFMDQNVPSVISASTTVTGAINLTAGYAAGTTVLVVNGFSAAIANGSWMTINGLPYRITATSGGSTPIGITIAGGLLAPVLNSAVITVYAPALVNLVAGYAANWYKPIVYNTITPIRGGQLVGDASGNLYSAIDGTDATNLVTDRPLDAPLANGAVLGLGPTGEYGLAFHRNAIAFVTRPLATPRKGTGALSSVASYNGLGLRVTITYDGKAQGHRVTLDMLCGVKTLDTNLGCVVLG